MSSTTRRVVLWISIPVAAFAIVGGFLSRVTAGEDAYQHLKIFDDVVGLITSNYVEKVDIDKVMDGAMNGLTESLDPDSAFLTASEVKQAESSAPMPAGDVGLDLTRQYYLRVIAAVLLYENDDAAEPAPREAQQMGAMLCGFLTIIRIQLCGLVHWNSLTVPSSVTLFM